MLQECHLPSALLADTRRLVHQLLPAYCMFATRSKRSESRLQVVTLVHCYVAARASLLAITDQLGAVAAAPPELGAHVHALRLIEPRTGASLLVVNARQFQATQPAHQAVLLELIRLILVRWADGVDVVVIGASWNASLAPRHGYSGLSHIRVADERLAESSASSRLTCAAPGDSAGRLPG